MKKITKITYLVVTIFGITGIFIGGYFGGIITGICTTLFTLAYFGQKLATKSFRKINKIILDEKIYSN